jgi:hypothetical protein
MMLVEGDVKNYEALMQSSCETYLVAIEAFVKKIKLSEPKDKKKMF